MENLLKQDSILTLEGPLQEEAQPVHKDDYASSLRAHGITNYTESEQYYHVGEPIVSQGWLLHITVIAEQGRKLLDTILPTLLSFQVVFKLVKHKQGNIQINDGVWGHFKIGKVVTVFLEEPSVIEPLMQELIELTANRFTGPQPLTDFRLTNILFVRYGSFIPRIEMDAWGNNMRLIQDGMGNLFLDQYYAPPVIPPGIANPFLGLPLPIPTTTKAPSKVYLLANKYMPVKQLKSDTKGDVWKALYFNKWLIPKWCILKEGKKGMFADEYDRDIRNRLSWQYRLHQSLAGRLSMPKTLDLVEQQGTSSVFLVLEYVKNSQHLKDTIYRVLGTTAWFAQPLAIKMEVLDYILQILNNIGRLHEYQYIHRDITGANFLVDKHKKIQLIDLELAWSVKEHFPDPPFMKGTPGYMSPEQNARLAPQQTDDTYAIGALLILVFTSGIEPVTLVDKDRALLSRRLFFWIGDAGITSLVMQCLAAPDERPGIGAIHTTISEYLTSLQQQSQSVATPPVMYDSLHMQRIIQQAIVTLGGQLLTHQDLWFSKVDNFYGPDVYPLGNKHVFGALYRGIGGVLYLLGRAQQAGLDITSARKQILAGIQFLGETMIANMDRIVLSLYYGKAGLALTLAEAIINELIPDTPYYRNVIRNCFLQPVSGHDVLYGVAGQGLGALQCRDYIEEDTLHDITTSYANSLIQAQQKDGSWAKSVPGKKKDTLEKHTSFGVGVAGIVYFLLAHYERYHYQSSLIAARKGLQWLMKQARFTKGHYEWPTSNRNKGVGWWWSDGAPGIALSFLKAYEITKEERYLDIAEKALQMHPKYLVHANLGQSQGLSGLGEVYLEAYRITRNKEWWDRAAWLANQLINFSNRNEINEVYWITEQYQFSTADFMIGNSGIIHFLLRFSNPDKFGFPIIG